MAESLLIGLRLDAPAQARRWIRDVCSAHGLAGLVDDATLLVSELVTNAVLHARTPCRIRAEVGHHTLRIHVMDEDPTDIQPLAPGGGGESGQGLAIVAALSTDWGVTHHHAGKSVWFTLAETDRAAALATVNDAYPTEERVRTLTQSRRPGSESTRRSGGAGSTNADRNRSRSS